jgi:hypothetical protein
MGNRREHWRQAPAADTGRRYLKLARISAAVLHEPGRKTGIQVALTGKTGYFYRDGRRGIRNV